MASSDTERPRFGTVAVLGAPNAGKSTLVNFLVGSKVSIVTHKAQTTRTRIRGIANLGPAQVVFVDTPGLFSPRRVLDHAMISAAWAGLKDANAVLLLVDVARRPNDQRDRLFRDFRNRVSREVPAVLVLNKIDRVRRDTLLGLAAELNALASFEATFMISAMNGDGTDELAQWLIQSMPEGPWRYPEQQSADLPLRLLAAEITREKLLMRLHDEIPHNLTVETVAWRRLKSGTTRIEQDVLVARNSHRRIAIGKGGQTLAAVGRSAREEIGEAVGAPVELFLRVKTRPNWTGNPRHYTDMGLEFPVLKPGQVP